MPAWLRRALFVAGAVWTFPNTLAGLLLGVPALACGARLRCSDEAIVFVDYPWGPGGALALGNVIVCTSPSLDVRCLSYAERAGLCRPSGTTLRLGDHERAHVRQAMVLGVFYLPAYLLCGGIGAHNRFEQAADRHAATGHGWWPWPRPDTTVR